MFAEGFIKFLTERGVSEDEAEVIAAEVSRIERAHDINVDYYVPYSEQYDKKFQLDAILNTEERSDARVKYALERYLHFALEANETSRSAFVVLEVLPYGTYRLHSEKYDRTVDMTIQFFDVEKPIPGDKLEMPDDMIRMESDSPLFTNRMLSLGKPTKPRIFVDGFKVEGDYAFLTTAKKRILLQRYYG